MTKLELYSDHPIIGQPILKDVAINPRLHDATAFSVWIGNHIPSENFYSLKYIVGHGITDSGSTFCKDYSEAYRWACRDFRNAGKKVLLYLGKFPDQGRDIDGGSILARQLIDTLKHRCHLDLAFIRKTPEIYSDPYIENVFYFSYLDAFNNKFIRRLENLKTNQMALKHFQNYDAIITAHISKLFGMQCEGNDFFNKAILFPMFLTPSYLKSGEKVPLEYTKQERQVLSKCKNIITPSEEERDDLINFYGCNPDEIHLIRRGISPKFHPFTEPNLEKIRMICIGSIKPQKNNLASLILLKRLLQDGFDAHLDIVCTVQDKELLNEMKKYIQQNELHSKVQFHFTISQQKLAALIFNENINISLSHWETFGRSIFEGVAGGLPTFVLDCLTEVEKIVQGNKAVAFCKDILSMAKSIERCITHPECYAEMRGACESLAEKVSFKQERDRLISALLGE